MSIERVVIKMVNTHTLTHTHTYVRALSLIPVRHICYNEDKKDVSYHNTSELVQKPRKQKLLYLTTCFRVVKDK